MNNPRYPLYLWLIPALVALTLLSACAPPGGVAPSPALQEQFQQMLKQQSEQAELLRTLQQQVTQLQQQVEGEAQVSAKITGQPAPPQPVTTPEQAAPAPIIPDTARQEITSLTASASSYLAAFSELAAGHYAAAEAGFQKFLQDFPGHQYAANARFWLASAQSAQGKLQQATDNLRLILSDPKGKDRAPAALLQLARIYRQQGLASQADEILEQLRNSYPDSQEAQHLSGSEPQ